MAEQFVGAGVIEHINQNKYAGTGADEGDIAGLSANVRTGVKHKAESAEAYAKKRCDAPQ